MEWGIECSMEWGIDGVWSGVLMGYGVEYGVGY